MGIDRFNEFAPGAQGEGIAETESLWRVSLNPVCF